MRFSPALLKGHNKIVVFICDFRLIFFHLSLVTSDVLK